MVVPSNVQDPKRLAENLSDLLKNIGVNFLPSQTTDATKDKKDYEQAKTISNSRQVSRPHSPTNEDDNASEGANEFRHAWSKVVMPATDQPQDLYNMLQRPGGETALLRLQHLFGDIARQLVFDRGRRGEYFASNSYSRTFSAMDLERNLTRNNSKMPPASGHFLSEENNPEDIFQSLPPICWEGDPSVAMDDDLNLFESRTALVVKPIVVGDSIPPPVDCPLPVLHVSDFFFVLLICSQYYVFVTYLVAV